MPVFNLSPSRIARYFYHECERYLRFYATPRGDREAAGIPQPVPVKGLVTGQILESGYAWERDVVTRYLGTVVRIADGTGPLHERSFSYQETLGLLRQMDHGEYLYQPTLEVPPSFLQRYGLDSERYRFPACRPDLLELQVDTAGKRRLRIIDIKASDALKTSHRIQTTLYGLILRDILSSEQLDLDVDLHEAAVWLYGQEQPEWFELDTGRRIVERFLREDLPEILDQEPNQVPWHLFFRCEWCEFYDHCRDEAERTDSVSLLPFLSVHGRRYLRQAPWQAPAIDTLTDLEKFLDSADSNQVDKQLDASSNLRNRRERLGNAIRALREGEVIAHGGASLALPIREDIRLVLTLQNDPLSGQLYATGFHRFGGKEVFDTGADTRLFIAGNPKECKEICRSFLVALFAELRTLHDFNAQRDWSDRKSLQLYVFDGYEHTLLHQLLTNALSDPQLAPPALQLLFFFQSEQLADEASHPDTVEVPYPVIILTHVIRRLVALPEPLGLRLPEVLQHLPSPRFDYSLEPSDLFWFRLSNTMKSDALLMAWNDRTEALGWIEKELGQRLRATSVVVDGLRAKAGDKLFAWPPKFLFPNALTFIHEEISQLVFIVRYESFMAAMTVRDSRTGPWTERLRDGISIPLEKVGDRRWRVLSSLGISQLSVSDFPDRLLVADGPNGERAQMSFNDYRNRKTLWSNPDRGLWVASVTHIDLPNARAEITHLELDPKDVDPFKPGDRAVLHPRSIDFTSDRIVECLEALDNQPGNPLLRIIRDPAGFATPMNEPEEVREILDQLSGPPLTASQTEAFRHLSRRRLTLVWGPPGTGKTYFLARALVNLVIASALTDGRCLRIGVTAFTHAAIENLLLAIGGIVAELDLGRHLDVRKLKDIRTRRAQDQGLRAIPESQSASLGHGRSFVIGGTVYSFRKARECGLQPVDLLIVDEASQMKFGEFALAVPSLDGYRGRLVLAGDDLQLPPIINGTYPDREDGLPGLHDSIFSYLRARDDPSRPYTCELTENWRMNATLSRFPALHLYGERYRPATDEVAAQRIQLAPAPTVAIEPGSELVEWLLAPEHPLTVGIVDGVQASRANLAEAELVARITLALRSRLQSAEGYPYPAGQAGDSLFWREGLFVVSPHHAQIDAIQLALARGRHWDSLPFVDTVDKMQGQESRVVIVSYGVSDSETALQEGEFIYSLNRLNVAITRARAKCVVLLPMPLLEPSFDLLANAKAAKGLAFMQGLVDYCAASSDGIQEALTFLAQGAGASLKAWRV